MEDPQRLRFFTDRHEIIRLFTERLNEDPSDDPKIIFFHGDGGNGKSLLLEILHRNYCKCLAGENWEWVKSLPVKSFEHNLKRAQGAEPVPAALLDFDPLATDDEAPRRGYSALLMLRRKLRASPGGGRLRFPLYDFATVWYLREHLREPKEKAKSLFPSEEMDFAAELVDLVYEGSRTVKVGSKVLVLFDKHFLGGWFARYKERQGLDKSRIEEIENMSSKTLVRSLPRLFAEDLNEAMQIEGAPKRVALFFDAHEAFWGHERDMLPHELYFERDEWLRSLLKHLRPDLGIVMVLSGREPPRWDNKYVVERIDRRQMDCRWVGHFSEPEARHYLRRAKVLDPDMQLCLINFARVEEDQIPVQIHPLYLSLCADVVLEARKEGRDLSPREFREGDNARSRGQTLLRKLLRYADSNIECAVRALSATRDFDMKTYTWLGKELDFETSRDRFEKLTRFSFVWQVGRPGEGRYRIHELIRRTLKEQEDGLREMAHAKLRDRDLEEVGGWPKRPGAESSLVL